MSLEPKIVLYGLFFFVLFGCHDGNTDKRDIEKEKRLEELSNLVPSDNLTFRDKWEFILLRHITPIPVVENYFHLVEEIRQYDIDSCLKCTDNFKKELKVQIALWEEYAYLTQKIEKENNFKRRKKEHDSLVTKLRESKARLAIIEPSIFRER